MKCKTIDMICIKWFRICKQIYNSITTDEQIHRFKIRHLSPIWHNITKYKDYRHAFHSVLRHYTIFPPEYEHQHYLKLAKHSPIHKLHIFL